MQTIVEEVRKGQVVGMMEIPEGLYKFNYNRIIKESKIEEETEDKMWGGDKKKK